MTIKRRRVMLKNIILAKTIKIKNIIILGMKINKTQLMIQIGLNNRKFKKKKVEMNLQNY